MSLESIDFHGRPAIRLALPGGDTCTIALHGAQVLSWTTADGTERFYLSPDAVFDGKSAIRGGTPLCWPQFNARGPLSKHGFARNVAWTVEAGSEDAPHQATLSLHDDADTRALWPHAFHAVLRVELASGSLRIELSVTHRGGEPWSFAAALHSYLRVDDIGDVRLEGLQGANRWDSLRDERQVETAAALRFDSEFDSVYTAQPAPLRLVQPSGVLEIAQSASCTETVVWNPGAALCATLADMPDDGYRQMLCVEAARIDEPVLLAPGARWTGWQQLTVR
ncbi:MAG: D-hexose-6-phosphate mutarotase [Janthinobacterium lividum]